MNSTQATVTARANQPTAGNNSLSTSSNSNSTGAAKRHHGNSRPRRPRKLKLEDDEEEIIKIEERIEFQKVLDNQLKSLETETIEPLPECQDKYHLQSPISGNGGYQTSFDSFVRTSDNDDDSDDDEEIDGLGTSTVKSEGEDEEAAIITSSDAKQLNNCMFILLQYQSFRSYVNYSEDVEKQNEQVQAQKMDRFQLMKKKRAIRREKRKSFKQQKTKALSQMMTMAQQSSNMMMTSAPPPSTLPSSQQNPLMAPVLFTPPVFNVQQQTLASSSSHNMTYNPCAHSMPMNPISSLQGNGLQAMAPQPYYTPMMAMNNSTCTYPPNLSCPQTSNSNGITSHDIAIRQEQRQFPAEEPSAKRIKIMTEPSALLTATNQPMNCGASTCLACCFPEQQQSMQLLKDTTTESHGPAYAASSIVQDDDEEDYRRLDSMIDDLLESARPESSPPPSFSAPTLSLHGQHVDATIVPSSQILLPSLNYVMVREACMASRNSICPPSSFPPFQSWPSTGAYPPHQYY